MASMMSNTLFSFNGLPPVLFPVLAVHCQRCVCLTVELDERHASTAGALQGAVAAAALSPKQVIGDLAKSAKAIRSLGKQINTRLTSDLADGCTPERINMERGS